MKIVLECDKYCDLPIPLVMARYNPCLTTSYKAYYFRRINAATSLKHV